MAKPIETSAGKIGEEMKTFDINTALDDAGFPEFLALHQDAEVLDMKNVEEIKSRYATFKLKELVVDEYKGVVFEHIKGEMGVTLDDADFADAKSHLEKLALENPDQLKALAETIHRFKTLPGEIQALETQIIEKGGSSSELSNRLKDLSAEKESVELSKEAMGLFGIRETFVRVREILAPNGTEEEIEDYYAEFFRLKGVSTDDLNNLEEITSFLAADGREEMAKEAKEYVLKKAAENNIASARDRFDEKYGRNRATRGEAKKISEDLAKQIAGLKGAVAAVEKIEDMAKKAKEGYGQQRRVLLGSMSLYDSVRRGVAEKVAKEISGKAKAVRTIEDAEALQERANNIANIRGTTETGIDPTAGFADFANSQAKMESELEAKAKEIMKTAMNKISIATTGLTSLRESVRTFIDRTRLGLKTGEDAKLKITQLLQSAADELGATTEGVAKRLLLRRIISEII